MPEAPQIFGFELCGFRIEMVWNSHRRHPYPYRRETLPTALRSEGLHARGPASDPPAQLIKQTPLNVKSQFGVCRAQRGGEGFWRKPFHESLATPPLQELSQRPIRHHLFEGMAQLSDIPGLHEQREITAGFAGGAAVLLLLGGALSLRWFGRLP